MPTVIVTGASMGIGRALALAFADEKATLILSARGRDALEEVAREVCARGARAVVVPGDVTAEAHRAAKTVRAVLRGTPVVETSNFVRVASATSRLAPSILRRALRRMASKP